MSINKTYIHPKNVVSAYADLLEIVNEQGEPKPLTILPLALPESALPFPLLTIRHALAIFLLHEKYIEQRDIIEDAYSYLDNFIPDEEYEMFNSLQESISKKEHREYSNGAKPAHISDTMKRLQIRTRTIRERTTKSTQELNSLRRIMGISDEAAGNENNTDNPAYDDTQEFKLQL